MDRIALTADMVITHGKSQRLFLTADEWNALPDLVATLPATDARKVARMCGMDCGKAKLIETLR